MIEGYVDGLDRNGIWGWARRVGSDEPVVVEFVCDGSVIASTEASGYRRDLSETGLPPCAFEFDPGLFELISPSSKIGIRVSGERVALNNGVRDPNLQGSMKYAWAWTRPATLDELNRDIHDSWPIDRLYERAARYHDIAFNDLLKGTKLPEAPKILEIGSGVGWLMQVLIDLLPKAHVTGLDVSETMIARAQERLGALPSKGRYAGKLDFVLYGGRDFPFSRDQFDII